MKSIIRFVTFTIASVMLTAASAVAGQASAVTGTVLRGSTSAPIANAVVVLEGPATFTAITDDKGAFRIAGVTPGAYHLTVQADGFLTERTELSVSGTATPVEVRLAVNPHYSEVVSVSPEARSQFDSYQPTSVLGGQDLAKQLQSTIGATLANEPGVTMRAFGPGPARPVIRGLDGDRVLVLENGTRMGDLSSQSGDHGVNINPAGASTIEVVRGPATLLYGANAIGGLVNVVTRSIPMAPVTKATGSITFDGASAAGEAGVAGDVTAGVGNLAVHFAANGRRAGDYRSPDGDIANSFNRSGAVDGGVSYVTNNGYIGASVAYDKSHYGIPFVEEGETNLNPRRKVLDIRAEQRNLGGFINSFRASLGVRRYEHNELDGEEIATTFENDTNEFELFLGHRPAGRLKGTLGLWGLTRSFSATGEEALSPQVDQKGFAMFFYEEANLTPHLALQFGARADHTRFTPAQDYMSRTFTNASGSIGLLIHPTDSTAIAVSLARAARNPALEELYFHGPHPGNNAIENGNDRLESEHANGIDASVRWQGARATGEVSFFVNQIDNFIFRELTGEREDDLPVTFFAQGDARLVGMEAHVDLHLAEPLWLEGGVDVMRGDLTSSNTPLPRMPPARGRLGLRFQHNAFQAGIEGTVTAKQDRVFTFNGAGEAVGETPTAGYNLIKLYTAYSFSAGTTTHTISVRLDNAGNTRYRNHLNYLKDLAPEVGRDFRVSWKVQF